MAQDVMILRRAISICEGHGKGWALKIKTFLGPEMALASLVAISGPKIVQAHITNRYIGNFMYMSFRAHLFQWPSLP